MENNKINDNICLGNEESDVIEIRNQAFVNGVQSDLNLTNEQKLEYIGKLIQAVDRKFETSKLNKKLVREQTKK